MSKYGNPVKLTKQSLNHLWAQPQLFTFPGVAIVGCSAVLWIVFVHMTTLTAVLVTGVFGSYSTDIQKLVFAYCMVFEVYVLGTAVLSFCNAGLVYCSNQSLDGEEIRIRDGFMKAAYSLPTILLYALFLASIGTILEILERQFKSVQRLITSIAGFGIDLLTFFVIPITVLEENRPIWKTFTQSGQLASQTWRETGVTSLTIMIIVLVPFGIPFILMVFIMLVDMTIGTRISETILAHDWLLFMIIALPLIGIIINSSVTAVAKTTLYREVVDSDTTTVDESTVDSIVGNRG